MSVPRYIIDGEKKPIRCDDPLRWGTWMTAARGEQEHLIGRTAVGKGNAASLVSTLFTGIPAQVIVLAHRGNMRPLLWETLVFGGPAHGTRRYYASHNEAVDGHGEIVSGLEDGTLRRDELRDDVTDDDCNQHEMSSRVDPRAL